MTIKNLVKLKWMVNLIVLSQKFLDVIKLKKILL